MSLCLEKKNNGILSRRVSILPKFSSFFKRKEKKTNRTLLTQAVKLGYQLKEIKEPEMKKNQVPFYQLLIVEVIVFW